MRFRSKGLLATLVAGFFLLTGAGPAVAAETTSSEIVIVREEDVLPDDLYAGAIRVVIEGTLDGDLVAFAAEEIVIEGKVNGSVTAVAPQVTVNGEVEGPMRLTANRLDISGSVGDDVVAAVVTAHLAPSSEVAGEVILWAWSAASLGKIGEDLTGTQRSLDLAGVIGGDVGVSVSQLSITGELTVAGDLGYSSTEVAEGLDRASVEGVVVAERPLPPNLRVRALGLLVRFLVVVFLSIAALTAAYGWPGRTTNAIRVAGRSPWRKWLRGALVLFSPLLAIAVAALIVGLGPAAAALPLLAVMVPVILALTGLVFALALVAGAPVAGWIGGVAFKRLDLYGAVLAGSVLVGVVWYFPLLGWFVPLIVLPWGLGSWMAAWQDQSPGESMAPNLVSAPD